MSDSNSLSDQILVGEFGSIFVEDKQVWISMDFIQRGMCFPFDVLDLGEPVNLFEGDHDTRQVTSGNRLG